tara:strand:+ start:23 stop:1354 length:1332 start_codon:yes stop_codon:yes gene_type:complete
LKFEGAAIARVTTMTSVAIKHPRPVSASSTRSTRSSGSAQPQRPQQRPGSAASSTASLNQTKSLNVSFDDDDEPRARRQGREVLAQQDRELSAIEANVQQRGGAPEQQRREEFERKRKECLQKKEADQLETALLQKLLARTPGGQLPSAAWKLLLRTFRYMDTDGDGTATFDEFLHVAARLGMCTSLPPNAEERRKLKALYDRNDKSGCGYLDYEAFCRELGGHAMLDSRPPPPTLPGRGEEMQAISRRSEEMGAALRGRLREGPEGRLLVQEAQEAWFQNAPAQRLDVRRQLDAVARRQTEVEQEKRRTLDEDARRRHARAEQGRLEAEHKARAVALQEKKRAHEGRVRLQQAEQGTREEEAAQQRESHARMRKEWHDRQRREHEQVLEARREQHEVRRQYEQMMMAERAKEAVHGGGRSYHPRDGLRGWSASKMNSRSGPR